ncbi:hypothetical protein GXW71_24280, partial [Roseomonas hellenica]
AAPAERQEAPRRDDRRDQQRHGARPGGGQWQGKRPDRPRQEGEGPRRDDRGPRRPREERASLPPMPKADSPFAVLAKLLRKD